MSSITIIIAIIVLLAALLCYAFISQAIIHKRQQKARMLAGFQSRSRNFKYMLNGFPKGFLPKDLTLLVQRSLLHVCEQLTKLDPGDSSHQQDLENITQQMAVTQQQPASKVSSSSIDNPQQSQEIKACLEELYKFVFHLEGNKEMPRQQADTYRAMIKHLVLQLTVDSYILHGRIAKDKEKIQLALHYFNLGLNLMLKEQNNAHFEGRISQLNSVIKELTEQQATSENKPVNKVKLDDETSDEWDSFTEEEGNWKKKQIYD